MDLFNNKQEEEAIKQLEKAFKKCAEIGIKFSVMDGELLYANKRLYKACLEVENKQKGFINGHYPAIAYSKDTDLEYSYNVNCSGSMESCGGW